MAGIVFGDEAIDERGVDSRRAEAVAADVLLDEIRGDRIGHGEYGALGHRVGKPVGDAGERYNGSEVEDDTPPALIIWGRVVWMQL